MDGEAYYAMAVLSELRIIEAYLISLLEAPVEALLLHAAMFGMHAQSSHPSASTGSDTPARTATSNYGTSTSGLSPSESSA